MAIQNDALKVLQAIAEFEEVPNDENRGRHNLSGEGVKHGLDTKKFHMSYGQINDAINYLESRGFVEIVKRFGTDPYDFGGVELTVNGRDFYESQLVQPDVNTVQNPTATSVFIGHGRSAVWRDLKDFLTERLKVEYDEFNREAVAGYSTKERLQQMLTKNNFAFLVMTAEDETADGNRVARANVVHEIGLFQGRLGFEKAIVLLEEGCEEFSNIIGLSQIRFPNGNIRSVFEEIRRVLEREGIIPHS